MGKRKKYFRKIGRPKPTFQKRKVPPRKEIEKYSKVSKNASKWGSIFSGTEINISSNNSLTNIGGLSVNKVNYGGSKKVIVNNRKKIELENIPFNFAYVDDSIRNCMEPYLLMLKETLNLPNIISIVYKKNTNFDEFLNKCEYIKDGKHIAMTFNFLYRYKDKVMNFIRKRKNVRFFCYNDH